MKIYRQYRHAASSNWIGKLNLQDRGKLIQYDKAKSTHIIIHLLILFIHFYVHLGTKTNISLVRINRPDIFTNNKKTKTFEQYFIVFRF